jgi:hypothetical protein
VCASADAVSLNNLSRTHSEAYNLELPAAYPAPKFEIKKMINYWPPHCDRNATVADLMWADLM